MKDIVKNNAKNVKNAEKSKNPVVLLAPLDWGLGHATRCIPLIYYMKSIDFEIIIAGEGAQVAVLREEFPDLKCVDLKGYRLQYGSSGWKTFFNILLQIPKILIAIKREKNWLSAFLRQNKVDFIISDNRYGFYHPRVPSIFITHQLQIKGPGGRRTERVLRALHYHYIEKFTECWVPDYEGAHNLAGQLAHPAKLPRIPVKYLGALSRFSKEVDIATVAGSTQLPKAAAPELLIILSGPEPQRTLLENILLRELKDFTGRAVMLRGLPGSKEKPADFNQITLYNHLPRGALHQLIKESGIILSRSGYSTIMDLLPLGKKCIFIPTPGQTEQQYLAEYLAGKSYCVFFHQVGLSLEKALAACRSAHLQPFTVPAEVGFRKVIQSLWITIRKNY